MPELDRIACMEDFKYTEMSITLHGKRCFIRSLPVSIFRELVLTSGDSLQLVFQHSTGSTRHQFFLPVGSFELTNIVEPWNTTAVIFNDEMRCHIWCTLLPPILCWMLYFLICRRAINVERRLQNDASGYKEISVSFW